MKLLIAGGGTGGHLFPALSIAEEFAQRESGNRVLFVGTRSGLEWRILKKKGFSVEYVCASGILGRGVLRAITASIKAFAALAQSMAIIRRFKPHVALGAGGYVSGPVVLAAFLLRVPTVICEQNSIPGITNRLLGKIADKIMVTFEKSAKYFPREKTTVSGNPLRKEILEAQAREGRNGMFRIFVLGGSQGARRLNFSVPQALGLLSQRDLQIVHQTGESDLDSVMKLYRERGLEARVEPFIEDIGSVYAGSDLVVSRSGAGTLAEITARGLPSVLVPYPYATHDHQMENARVIEDGGAGVVIRDEELSPERLAGVLEGLLDKRLLTQMGEASKRLGKPQAAKTVVDAIYELCGSRQQEQRHVRKR